jgi:tRNA uracil 4-sulfurtransferase
MKRALILHYHEIWLKGGNRNFFLSRLVAAVKAALGGLDFEPLEHISDRLILVPKDPSCLPEMSARLRRVFGLAYIAEAVEVPPSAEEMAAPACELVAAKAPRSFAVRAKIACAGFGMNSMELERGLGREILNFLRARSAEVRVKLNDPEVTCWVEIVSGRAFLYTERVEGAGGLPAATSGRLVVLLSGGFDSAVAAYKIMRRGAHTSFVHFRGGTSPGRGSSGPIAREIVAQLTPYQFTSRLYLVDFDSVQRRIVANAPESFRVLLYRRMMARIAIEIARAEHALGLVTGDSVSQVASQTLHNLAAIDHGVGVPIYRPLAGDDKEEILRLARRIGTFKISCEPFEDCCPRFMPRSPAIFATPEELDRAEAHLDIEALVTLGLAGASALDFKYESGTVSCQAARPRRLEKILARRSGMPDPTAPSRTVSAPS